MNVKVKVRNLSGSLALPKYETLYSAGMDVMACFDCGSGVKGYDWFSREMVEYPVNKDSTVTINPGERALIPTGLKVEIPDGYEIQVRPRSGLALKKGITVLNTPGTIDADYRGMIGIILINNSNEPFYINHGDRIAQIILKEVPRIEWDQVAELSSTERGDGGFGHTGVSEGVPPEQTRSGDQNRTPSFQVGDRLDGVGIIKDVNFEPASETFIYDVDTGDGEIEKMPEIDILNIVL